VSAVGWLLAIFVSVGSIGLAARRAAASVELATMTLTSWLVLIVLGFLLPRAAGAGELLPAGIGIGLAVLVLAMTTALGTSLKVAARRYGVALRKLVALPVVAALASARALSVTLLGWLLSLVVLWSLLEGTNVAMVETLGLAPGRLPSAPMLSTLAEPLSTLLRLILACLCIACGFLLTLRQGADRVAALGWGCVLFLTPGVLQSLRSTDSDLLSQVLILAALTLAAFAQLTLLDSLVAFAALAAVASRHDWGWLEAAPAALAVAVFSLGAARRLGIARVLGVVAFGLVLLALAAVWARSQHAPAPGISFPIKNAGLLFEPPSAADPMSSGQGFGLGFAWATLPLAAIGLVLLAIECGTCFAYRIARSNPLRACPWPTLLVSLAALVPACFRAPSYALVVAAAFVPAAWLCSRLLLPRVAEAAIAINVLGALTFHWWYGW